MFLQGETKRKTDAIFVTGVGPQELCSVPLNQSDKGYPE